MLYAKQAYSLAAWANRRRSPRVELPCFPGGGEPGLLAAGGARRRVKQPKEAPGRGLPSELAFCAVLDLRLPRSLVLIAFVFIHTRPVCREFGSPLFTSPWPDTL